MSSGLLGGIIVILLGAIICAYTGNQLSENWTILQERWPEYRHHCRKPYPAMGYRALGPKFMRRRKVLTSRRENFARKQASNSFMFFMSFGTVMFAYGGHGAFPTIQHDMKKPYHFRRSVFLAFAIICTMYAPVSNLWIQQAVNVLITLHVVLALTIVFNPINQEFEEMLNVPQGLQFGVKRVLCRSAMMAAVVFVAETVPEFGKHEGKLAASGENWITISEFAVGVIGGLAATWSATNIMLGAEFSPPCYAGIFHSAPAVLDNATIPFRYGFTSTFPNTQVIAHVCVPFDYLCLTFTNHGKLNCCGMFRNFSTSFSVSLS
uniref:Amino acid transporter transmembrane domain-containing protein n=1 Tax=Parascaris equorum TaxID=6256 RepID=A0A914S560_PAREQ